MKFINYSGFWKKETEKENQRYDLKDVSFTFRNKGYYGITGVVGSGKSSLFGSIL